MLRDVPMDGESLLAWVQQMLASALRPGGIVFIDNLRTHKIDGVREAIVVGGATIRYLPAYCPTSTQSRWYSRNSKPRCAKAPSAL